MRKHSLLVLALLGTAALVAGCSQKEATPTAAGGGPIVNAPPAAPNSSLTVNNPPPGQPNHLTPEMQAQIERYRSMKK